MKFIKGLAPWLCSSKDEQRFIINSVHYDGTGHLIATDGRRGVLVPVEDAGADTTAFTMGVRLCKEVAKCLGAQVSKKLGHLFKAEVHAATASETGRPLVTASVRTPDGDRTVTEPAVEGMYPNFKVCAFTPLDHLVNTGRGLAISFNPYLLAEMAEAMGVSDKMSGMVNSVTMIITTDEHGRNKGDALVVVPGPGPEIHGSGTHCFGLLMPMRQDMADVHGSFSNALRGVRDYCRTGDLKPAVPPAPPAPPPPRSMTAGGAPLPPAYTSATTPPPVAT